MKKILFLAILLVNTALFAQTDPSATPTDCTNAFFKGMLDENGTIIEKVITDDFTIISYDGMMADKDLVLQGVNGGFVVIETATVEDLRVRTYGDAAVVTGTWKAKGAIQGNTLSSQIVFSAMCVKVAGNWKMANMQFTAAQ
ncbi:MAG: nuclear transport factor 2 family protein [Runella slithyformis]|jgi:ketosteroid isomerase-like protein|nr:MAG: nuclear transport factor 2 family protein [Runella sp.]TAG16212.1 MAG: nuclear transport factor 2 family protein [Cytophagales bacterium]TAG35476.1 MAG: nuclear transport factor 2 family protein [Cytophagia bacterium]TAG51948.1 MAG: nuclear transport factor 2 family protein [Runella slithyformis]TAG69297.1 MAG: nuclear transport factor 2 family protein [Runella slithyformis]